MAITGPCALTCLTVATVQHGKEPCKHCKTEIHCCLFWYTVIYPMKPQWVGWNIYKA